jgi:hypothetical protein
VHASPGLYQISTSVSLFFQTGVLPHVPRMLPLMISDPEMRERVAETFTSDDFVNNIEEYFVQNIKVLLFKNKTGCSLMEHGYYFFYSAQQFFVISM